jgi:glycogen operon protein
MLNGKAGDYRTPEGEPADDDVLLIVTNAHHDAMPFTLPKVAGGAAWRRSLDTTDPEIADDASVHPVGEVVELPGRALVLFVCQPA